MPRGERIDAALATLDESAHPLWELIDTTLTACTQIARDHADRDKA